MRAALQGIVRTALLLKAARDEEIIRGLLEQWVSELEPAVAYRNGEVIGLTIADAEVGSYPHIFNPFVS